MDGIPTTTVVRTLLDIAPRLDEQQIERVLTRADRLELLDWRELQSRVLKPTHSRGIARLRRCVELANPLAVEAASETEEMFLALWRSTGWPDPVVNVSIEGFVVDFLWPECGVIVECDGYAYHSDRVAFERDRARDMKLKVAGYEVIRVTHRMLRDDPEGVLETVAEVLNARAGRIRDLAGQGS